MTLTRMTTFMALLVLGSPALANSALPVGTPNIMSETSAAYAQFQRTGAPKDAIPSIEEPKFWSATEAEGFLRDEDRIIGIYRNGQARAYPQRIMVWHEIVNDTFGSDPIAITYCPLTGTSLGFHRGENEFGVSGQLVNSNLVMYDRTTETHWPQILAAGIEGPLADEGLKEVRLIWTTWENWRARHPNTQVLSDRTGYVRHYRTDPYGSYTPPSGYYTNSRVHFPVLNEDPRFEKKKEVLGFRSPTGAFAVLPEALQASGVLHHEAADGHYLIIHDPGLETGWVFRGQERVEVDPTDIEFGPAGPRFDGLDQLEAVNAFEAMWFAWTAFYPDTVVIDG